MSAYNRYYEEDEKKEGSDYLVAETFDQGGQKKSLSAEVGGDDVVYNDGDGSYDNGNVVTGNDGGSGNETVVTEDDGSEATGTLAGLLAGIDSKKSEHETEKERRKQEAEDYWNRIMNDTFDTSGMAESLFASYANQYQKNASKAMKGAIAESALLSGGYANSWGQAVGQQAYADVMSNMGNDVAALLNAAYGQFKDEQNMKLKNYEHMTSEYDDWVDEDLDDIDGMIGEYNDAYGEAIDSVVDQFDDGDSVDTAAIESYLRESPLFAGLDDATLGQAVKDIVAKVTATVDARTAQEKQLAADQATVTLELIAKGVVDRDKLRMYLVASEAFADSSPEEIEAVIDTVVAEITEAQDLAKAEKDLALRQEQYAEDLVKQGLNNETEIVNNLKESGLFEGVGEGQLIEIARAIVADVTAAGAEDLELGQNQLVRELIQESVDNWRVYDEEAIYYIMDESGLFENVSEAKRKEIAYGIIQEATQRIQGNKNANKTAVADAAGVQADLVQELIEDPSLNNDFYITMRLREKGLITDDMTAEDIAAAVKRVKEAAETGDEEPENDLKPITPEQLAEAKRIRDQEGKDALLKYADDLAFMGYNSDGLVDLVGTYYKDGEEVKGEFGTKVNASNEVFDKISAIQNRDYKIAKDTKNHLGGMDRNDKYTYTDENGKEVTVKVIDIYRELIDAGMSKEKAKEWIVNVLGQGQK